MSDRGSVAVHWSFWVIAAFAMIWNVMGSINFVVQLSPSMVESFRESEQAIIIGRPMWATFGFAVSVFCGAIGGLLLLLRKAIAKFLFVASLFGTILTMLHTAAVDRSTYAFTPFEIFIMIVLPLLVAGLMLWYAQFASRKGWVS